MTTFFGRKLEPLALPDWADATRATVHDPLWFLARQWQLGEFQGENASTPVRADVVTRTRVISRPGSAVELDVVPPEPLVEGGGDDWWTVGRRLRVGRRIAQALGLAPENRWLLADPPPPYDQVVPAWDGLAMWRDPGLAVDPGLLPETPPDGRPAWVPQQLVHDQPDAFEAEGIALHLRRHRGGRLDWYSVDAEATAGLGAPEPTAQTPVIPAPLEYPGMPRRGVWEIEDADADIGAFAPDAAHSATAVMTALFFSHRDEWFGIPVRSDAGRVLRIVGITVTDSFGQEFSWADGAGVGDDGLAPPSDLVPTAWGALPWGVFRTQGLEPGELVLWQAADRPLQGEVVERVQFGVDDESNVVWAVERRLAQRDPGGGAAPLPSEDLPPGDLTRGRAYRYAPNQGAQAHWIPYTMPTEGERVLRQRRLVDLSGDVPRDLPAAAAELLQGAAAELPEAVVPVDGLQVERRWVLARDASGAPHLWVQHQRGPVVAAPARTLRFDLAVAVAPDP